MIKYFLYDFFFNNKNIKIIEKKLIPIKSVKKKDYNKIIAIYANLNNFYSSTYLNKYKNLKHIISATTSVNHIDTKFCKKKKINIVKLDTEDFKNLNIFSTAEHTFLLILLATRKFSFFLKNTFKGIWNREAFSFSEFRNYTIGIIGYGRIGKLINKYLKFFNFKILIYDINYGLKKPKNAVKLSKLLKLSDIITLNINYSKDNKNFFDKKKFNKCKNNVSIINTSRGEIISENDLLYFLKKNPSASAYLDVISDEQKKNNYTSFKKNILYNFYKKNNNLLFTPHIGGAALDAKIKTENFVIKKYLKEYK